MPILGDALRWQGAKGAAHGGRIALISTHGITTAKISYFGARLLVYA